MDFLDFTRPISFFVTYSKVHPGVTEAAVLEQMGELDAVKVNLKKLGGVGGGDDSGDADHEVDVAEFPTPHRYKKQNN